MRAFKLTNVVLDEVSLVDEPATGKKFKVFKRCVNCACRKIAEKFGKAHDPLAGKVLDPSFRILKQERDDLYMIKKAEPLEADGSFKVFVGFDGDKGAPPDEEIAAFVGEVMGGEITEYDFETPMVGEGEQPSYISGVVWTKEREKKPVEPTEESTQVLPGASAQVGTAGQGAPTGGIPGAGAGAVQSRGQKRKVKKQEESQGHIAWIGNMEYFVRNGQVYSADVSYVVMPDGYRTGRWYGAEDIRTIDRLAELAPAGGDEVKREIPLVGFGVNKQYEMLENDPEILDYAMQLVEELAPDGIVDDEIQVEIYEECMNRYGRREMSRFERFLRDLKWWAIGGGLAYLIFKQELSENERLFADALKALGGRGTLFDVLAKVRETNDGLEYDDAVEILNRLEMRGYLRIELPYYILSERLGKQGTWQWPGGVDNNMRALLLLLGEKPDGMTGTELTSKTSGWSWEMVRSVVQDMEQLGLVVIVHGRGGEGTAGTSQVFNTDIVVLTDKGAAIDTAYYDPLAKQRESVTEEQGAVLSALERIGGIGTVLDVQIEILTMIDVRPDEAEEIKKVLDGLVDAKYCSFDDRTGEYSLTEIAMKRRLRRVP